MQITVKTFTVHKRFPLTISRGTTAQTTNLWLKIESEGIEGWGEASPFSVIKGTSINPEKLQQELEKIIPTLEKFNPLQRQQIETVLLENNLNSSLRAAIDTALHDWLGKKVGLPLWKLWGLNCDCIVPTSVTISISSPEKAVERVKNWLNFMDAKLLKIKLGSPDGIEADKAMIVAIREATPHIPLTVDANGGWNIKNAIYMSDWLATQNVKYIEQPLEVGDEGNLPQLYQRSHLPIFVDESCFKSQDIIKLSPYVHGINIKLMKAGGLTEVMRVIAIAKACKLQIMYGCYSDSSLANTAMCHLAPYADYLDLDSHFNLIDDPFQGVTLEEGKLMLNNLPGLGVKKLN
ncbi:dipeptide epimerase [Aphanothece sacrum]|uniref:Dipeptide epimerase n=1 Tax=Aphanothece sacrum FPU1 TaxID=1920663 RepID=A0A401IE67_APHSA|nr:dipeptide epimerase [Aphanothece sacrum]GBF79509.1 mandelate racemase/muconate lactonizing enzyme [Aphanothece sacrum FPU1]GBF83950.1 mandelate racemase/muconate lactonizing enzyme [Aphanothece sacrum FPU3]